MFWKILGIVAAVWIALVVLGWVFKVVVGMVLPVLCLSVVVFGGYLLYKAVKGSKSSDTTRV